MRTQPLRASLSAVSTSARLWMAAMTSIVPLGLVWAKTQGHVTDGVFGPMVCDYNGTDCDPGVFTAGAYVPGSSTHVSSSPVRVFLVIAAVALVVTATRTRTAATRRLARLAVGALVVAVLLALGARAATTAACAVLAVILVVPAVWASAD